MDELDALRRMRTTLAREEDPDRLARRVDWRSGTASRALPRPRPRRRFMVPLLSMATTAAVAAGAVAVIASASDQEEPGGPGGRRHTLRTGSALLVAATNAEKAPDGRYWRTRRIDGVIYAVGESAADHYKVESRREYETWIDRKGRTRGFLGDLPARPLTAQDRQKWQQAGSPMTIEVPDVEGPSVLFVKPPSGRLPMKPVGDWRFYGLTRRQTAELPTRPEELEDALLDLEGDWHVYSSDPGDRPLRALRGRERVRALSDVAGDLLSTAPAPPRVRAAAFRMLAALPGVRAEGEAADPLGRTGTVISLPLETTVPLGIYTAPKQLGTYRRQWIIDPGTGTLLAVRDLVATPPRGARKLPPGDDARPRSLKAENQPDRFHRPGEVSSYRVYAVAEWTDAAPR